MTADEKKQILNMLAEGKITSEEALGLLNALGDDLREKARTRPKAKIIKIKVFRNESERPDVNIRVPLNLAQWAAKFIPKNSDLTINDKDIDLDKLTEILADIDPQDICEIDHEDGKVTITLEEE